MAILVCCATLQRPIGRCYNVRRHKALGNFGKGGARERGSGTLRRREEEKMKIKEVMQYTVYVDFTD
jgi:hypothetical protein